MTSFNKIKISIIFAITFSIIMSTGVFAASRPWYKDWLVLLRTGSMKTNARKALSNTQQTKVTSNKYDVLGRIVNKNGTALSNYKTHQDKNNSKEYAVAQNHKTNAKGSTIRAQFKTSLTNFKTTSATIAWRP